VLLAGDRSTTLADLLPLLADNDRIICTEAISAIGRLSCDRREAIGRLIESLAHEGASIRTAAALSLGQIGPDAAAAIPPLASILGDRHSADVKSWHYWPDEKNQRLVSLAEAARWAITAIEPPAP
jgi:hypothetical protein